MRNGHGEELFRLVGEISTLATCKDTETGRFIWLYIVSRVNSFVPAAYFLSEEAMVLLAAWFLVAFEESISYEPANAFWKRGEVIFSGRFSAHT